MTQDDPEARWMQRTLKHGLTEYVAKLLTQLNDIATVTAADQPARQLAFVKATYLYFINKLYKRFTGYEWLESFEGAFVTDCAEGTRRDQAAL